MPGVQGGLKAPGAISEAAGTGNILTELAVVLSDGLWAGEENWSVELEPETSVVLGEGLREGPGIFLTDEEHEIIEAE